MHQVSEKDFLLVGRLQKKTEKTVIDHYYDEETTLAGPTSTKVGKQSIWKKIFSDETHLSLKGALESQLSL